MYMQQCESFVTTLHAVFLAKYTLQLQPLGLGVEGSCEYVHLLPIIILIRTIDLFFRGE